MLIFHIVVMIFRVTTVNDFVLDCNNEMNDKSRLYLVKDLQNSEWDIDRPVVIDIYQYCQAAVWARLPPAYAPEWVLLEHAGPSSHPRARTHKVSVGLLGLRAAEPSVVDLHQKNMEN